MKQAMVDADTYAENHLSKKSRLLCLVSKNFPIFEA